MRSFLVCSVAFSLIGCAENQQTKIDTAITNVSTALHGQCDPLKDLVAAASILPVSAKVTAAVAAGQGALASYCAGPVSTNVAGAALALARVTVGLMAVLPARTTSLIMSKYPLRHRMRGDGRQRAP